MWPGNALTAADFSIFNRCLPCVGLAFSGKVSQTWAVTSIASEILTGGSLYLQVIDRVIVEKIFFSWIYASFYFLNFYRGKLVQYSEDMGGRSTI